MKFPGEERSLIKTYLRSLIKTDFIEQPSDGPPCIIMAEIDQLPPRSFRFADSGNQNWFYALLTCTALLFLSTFGIVAFSFHFYTGNVGNAIPTESVEDLKLT